MVLLNPREEDLEFDDPVSSGARAKWLTRQVGQPRRDVETLQVGKRWDVRVLLIQVANEAIDHRSGVDDGPGPQGSGDLFEVAISSISQPYCLACHRLSFVNTSR